MEIIVGNWPKQGDSYDLRKLFEREQRKLIFHRMMRRVFRRDRAMTSGHFRVVTDERSDGTVVRYGHAVIEPDEVARLAVARLNHFKYYDQVLSVREYFPRAYINDRRALNWRDRRWMGPERRAADRRGARASTLPQAF